MNNNISYVGNVTVRVKNRRPVKKHNNGTAAFFDALRDVLLLRADLSTTRLPMAMGIIRRPSDDINNNLNYDSDAYDNYRMVIAPMPITTRVPKLTDGNVEVTGAAHLSALLTSANTMNAPDSTDKNTTDIMILLLSGESNNKILAYSTYRYEDFKPVFDQTGGSQAVIEWDITFGNKEGN